MEGSVITARDGVAVRLMNEGKLDIERSQITAEGDRWQAVALYAGTTQIGASQLRTLGLNGHGLYVQGLGNGHWPR